MAIIVAGDSAGNEHNIHTRDLFFVAPYTAEQTLANVWDKATGKAKDIFIPSPYEAFRDCLQRNEPAAMVWAKPYDPKGRDIEVGVNPHYVSNVIVRFVMPHGTVIGIAKHPTSQILSECDHMGACRAVLMPFEAEGRIQTFLEQQRKQHPLEQHNDKVVRLGETSGTPQPAVVLDKAVLKKAAKVLCQP